MNNVVIEQSIQKKSKVDELKESCKRAMDTTEENYVIMGERLSELQEEMKKEGSNFIEWLEQDTRISYSTANRYIKVVQGYNTREEEVRRKHVAALGIKKAYLLLKIKNIDERYSFIKEKQIRYKSYEVTKELLAVYLNANHSDEKDSSHNKDILDKSKKNLIREIEKFNPRFGHGYPSSFFRLATLLENKKINIKLKGISLTSENLYEEQRKVIEKVFDCKARGFWGHTERLGIAIEKVNERNIYEIPLTYGLIEIIKENGIEAEEGEEGEIVCTGFINKGMKLIRYKTGDYATVHKKEKGIVIEIRNLIGKRGKEYLYTKNGQKISTASLTLHSKAQYEFKYIQLLQNEVEKVNVNVVLWDNKDVSKDIRALKEEFESKVQDIDFKINIVNEKEIKITHRGKIPYLITEINKIER